MATLPPTPTATHTPTPSPTSTPVPLPTEAHTPTATQISSSDPCAGINSGSFSTSRDEVAWTIINNGLATITIESIILDWPSGNDKLKKVMFEDRTIWNDHIESPPTTINSGWKGTIDKRELAPSEAKQLTFEFDEDAGSSGYSLTLDFDNGCQISDEG